MTKGKDALTIVNNALKRIKKAVAEIKAIPGVKFDWHYTIRYEEEEGTSRQRDGDPPSK